MLKEYVSYLHQFTSGARARHELWIDSLRAYDTATVSGQVIPLRILDLANGRLRAQYALLRAAGHTVSGTDLVNRPSRDWTELAYAGARRAFCAQTRLPAWSTDVRGLCCGDVRNLPYCDGSFDLVTSVAAFEHFYDVPRAVSELFRVLRPGGIAWVFVHLFTAPSGGHNVSLAQMPLRTLPAGVQPWDHLRSRALSFHVPLNEWRAPQYVECFGRYAATLRHYYVLPEGEHWLTPGVAVELAAYTREELTHRSLVIVATKATSNG